MRIKKKEEKKNQWKLCSLVNNSSPGGYCHAVAFAEVPEEKDIPFTVLSIRLNRCCRHIQP